MAFNLDGSAQISLSVFGGQVSEMAPTNLPEGVSPDCPDVVFTPGGVRTRPAFRKVFHDSFPQGIAPSPGPGMWGKTFLSPSGGIENLYLDANGFLWWEDVRNTPGVYSQIGTVDPNSYAKSVTAFGREYIAISDGLHGSDVPIQWDGTNLDRVTQDGPGTAPSVASIALPSVAMAAAGAIVLNLSESDPNGQVGTGNYTVINVFTTDSVAGVNVGDPLTIAGYGGGSAAMNGTWPILAIYSGVTSLLVLAASLPAGTAFSAAAATGTVPAGTMNRAGNIVTVNTAAAHQLRVGYQAQIGGIAAAVIGGGVTQIVINNDDLPGLATITTASAHKLIPGVRISLTAVAAVAVGTAVATCVYAGGVATVTMTGEHGLTPGSVVTLTGPGITVSVLTVPTTKAFTFAYSVAAPAAVTVVSLNWPIPDTAARSYLEIVAAPTATTFQVAIHYSSGTWTSGTVTFPWNGTYFVSAVPSATQFQYKHNGPNANTNTVGTVTPHGQAAPGEHHCRVSYLTRQGYITRPGPPTSFTANGGQYVALSNLPIGPANVVARIVQFTGAQGAFYFYVPAAAQVDGQIVSTGTQIDDNVSTDALLDFSDDTLFASIGTSQEGNDLASLAALEGALGFASFGSRLFAYGQRSRIQNLLNMGFDGGATPLAPTIPGGWSQTGAGGALVAGHFGVWWEVPAGVSISQSCYQDAYGAPIVSPNTRYRFRVWAKPAIESDAPIVTATISSATSGFSASAAVVPLAGFLSNWYEQIFSLPMPAVIPADMVLAITISGAGSAQVDDMSVVFDQAPYVLPALASYTNNPESFDGVTGVIGPVADTHPIMEAVSLDAGHDAALHFLTEDPGGRLHRVVDNGTTEPAFWPVVSVGSNCGVISAFGTTKSQADDGTASGGEEWFAWASATGARIYSGSEPWPISQEISPDWIGAEKAGASQWSSASGVRWSAKLTAWALNDPATKRIYFGLPLNASAPNAILVLDYRELDTAFQIWNAAPIHTSYSGRLIATDHARKWSPWGVAKNGAALMCRAPNSVEPIFFGGSFSNLPGIADRIASANVFSLDPAQFEDEYAGDIGAHYTTLFFPSRDAEQMFKLGGGRKMLAFVLGFIAGEGMVEIAPLCDALTNQWPLTGIRDLAAQPIHDIEWGGGNALGNRIALRISAGAVGTPPNHPWFDLQRLLVALRPVAHLPVRGVA